MAGPLSRISLPALVGSTFAALVVAGCAPTASTGARPGGGTLPAGGSAGSASVVGPDRHPGRNPAVPRPAHTIVVMMENHGYSQIIGNPQAPYLTGLARKGASFTHSLAITHPSEPNYLALFSGSTHGVTSDSCPHTFAGRNLGSELRAAGKRFVGYAESLPHAGYTGCYVGVYARKHVPWVNFSDLPASTNQPFRAFPKRFAKLPALSFVIPNLNHDMHNGTIAQGDSWLRTHLGRYIHAAMHHNGLVIITWDENEDVVPNQIPTIMVGAGVKPGKYAERIDHYRVLRTLEAAYGLHPLGESKHRRPITNIWRRAGTKSAGA
ncbi:MAG TPA: alkaline phosphatase family protein [Mycobacteriales bacterium]|nr:alkaline phosphatase family protein [Mycobacteriales bacterium]